MVESHLNSLELQVDSFVESFHKLALENNSLRKEIVRLNQDRATLLDRKNKISEHLKKIISQLQDELSCQTQ